MTTNANVNDDDFGGSGGGGNGGDGKRPSYFKIGMPPKGSNSVVKEYRIFPAYGNLRSVAREYVWLETHFGLTLPPRKEGQKPRVVPFLCLKEKDRNGQIKVVCPWDSYIDDAKDRAARKEKALLEKYTAPAPEGLGLSPNDAAAKVKKDMEPIERWLRAHNTDKKFRYAAMDRTGAIGYLDLSYKMNQRLQALVKKAKTGDKMPRIDPFAPDEGLWFRFSRTGEKIQTATEDVEIVTESKEDSDGSVRTTFPRAPITPEIRAEFKAVMTKSLDESVLRLTADQITAIIAAKEDPAVVEAIIFPTSGEKARAPNEPDSDPDADDDPLPDEVKSSAVSSSVLAAVGLDGDDADFEKLYGV